jgi:hypothetical protein
VPGLFNRTVLVALGRYTPRGALLALLRSGGDRIFSERSLERGRRLVSQSGTLLERRKRAA